MQLVPQQVDDVEAPQPMQQMGQMGGFLKNDCSKIWKVAGLGSEDRADRDRSGEPAARAVESGCRSILQLRAILLDRFFIVLSKPICTIDSRR